MITWDSRTLYDPPAVGTCEVSGKYETGRYYLKDNKRIFVSNSAAPKAVEDYVDFATALAQVNGFKRGYAKKDWVRT
jgi:hypothetical protein